MEIIEVSWIRDNKEKLTTSDKIRLDAFNFFEQLENGWFEMKWGRFMDMMKVVDDIYKSQQLRIETPTKDDMGTVDSSDG